MIYQMIHFSPLSNWLNDPNGLVYNAGEYNLFFQHQPYSLNWGHALSLDLIHCKHLPFALYPNENAMILGRRDRRLAQQTLPGFVRKPLALFILATKTTPKPKTWSTATTRFVSG
jgi:hypothetical protein